MENSPFHSRHIGLLDPTVMEQKSVLLVGAGSVGSVLAELLVRAGLRHLLIRDKDVVEESNLCRSVYTQSDIGRPKVEALRDRVTTVRSEVQVDARNVDLETVDDDVLRDEIARSDLVIAATDHPSTQLRLAALSYHSKPAIFAGVYAKGIGGEVIFTLPEETSCYACILGSLAGGSGPSRGTQEYGFTQGELKAEPALGIDIAHVTTCAAKVALGLLLLGTAAPAAKVIDPTRNLLLVGNSAEYVWRHPFDTAWVRTVRREHCLCRQDSTSELISKDVSDGFV